MALRAGVRVAGQELAVPAAHIGSSLIDCGFSESCIR